MSFFSEDRANELRTIFFESAQELLQALNEQGMRLEKQPGNPEIVREIRRAVHTLKGDSAACGYRELSEFAHALEDVLTDEIAASAGASVAETVLASADSFESMLTAYRRSEQPSSYPAVRVMIEQLRGTPVAEVTPFAPEFAWTEYDRLLISQHAVRGQNVYNVGLEIDPQCAMRSAALQLVRNVLEEVGTPLAIHPSEETAEPPSVIESALASHHPREWIEKKCHVPGVVSRIVVQQSVASAQETIETPVPSQATPANVEVPAPNQPEPEALHKQSTSLTNVENILRVEAERIDAVLDLVGELIIAKSMFQAAVSDFGRRFPKDALYHRLHDALGLQSQVMQKLQRSVMKIRMVPVEQLFRRFPRIVRDLSKQEGKQVDLVLEGENTDLDKSILDALAEPLAHMVRNAVDHGIEMPDERQLMGKSERATIVLKAYHLGNNVVIEVSDDGRGIDVERVRAKAIERGMISLEEAALLDDSETLKLILEPGFSTAEQVTEVSGRGVGMDVVKGVIDRMKGTISIQANRGSGSRFRLNLPLTLAIIKALLFRVSERLFAVPLTSVLEIMRASEKDVHVVGQHEVMQLREEVLPLVRLERMVNGTASEREGKLFVVVVGVGDRKFGLIVDRLVGEQELVLKALDDQFMSTEMVNGASVLGDGRVVLILNVPVAVERFGRADSANRSSLEASA